MADLNEEYIDEEECRRVWKAYRKLQEHPELFTHENWVTLKEKLGLENNG